MLKIINYGRDVINVIQHRTADKSNCTRLIHLSHIRQETHIHTHKDYNKMRVIITNFLEDDLVRKN